MSHLTLFKYEVFNTIFESGSLTKAAEILNLTQSGISHAISSLESELGLTLLNRDRSGISLTSDGERMLPYIQEILRINEKLHQEAEAIKGLEVGLLKIGTFTSVSTKWLPMVIKQLQDDFPGIAIKLVEGSYSSIEHWTLKGMIDCGFVILPTSKSIEAIPLKKDKMYCIVSQEHPLHLQKKISLKQLEIEPFIMPKETYDQEMKQFFQDSNITPNIKFQVSDEQTIIAMVQNNLGISIRPDLLLTDLPENVVKIELENDPYRLIGLISRPNASVTTKKFIQYLMDVVEENH